MSATLAPTFSPTYAGDTDATATIKIHKKGYCPKHPDIKIRTKNLLTKNSYSPCPRCEELHYIYKQQLESIQSNLSSLSDGGKIAELKGEMKVIESKNDELEDAAIAIIKKENNNVKVAREEIFEQKLRMKQVLFDSLNLKRMKVAVLGEGRVGKTSIIKRYLKNEFSPREVSTLQASYLEYADSNICFSMWDTAGQERFHALGPIYYRDADLVLLVYDITDECSFHKVQAWAKEIKKCAGDAIMLAVIGNKCELTKDRKVALTEVTAYCADIGCKYYEVSAKENIGLDECFTDVVVGLALKRQAERLRDKSNDVVKLKNKLVIYDDMPTATRKNSGGCC